jgi:hypothetical protein
MTQLEFPLIIPYEKSRHGLEFGPKQGSSAQDTEWNLPDGERESQKRGRLSGKIMYVVGESDGPDPIHERVYSLGPLADSNKTIRSYFCAMVLGMGAPETQRKIFDPKFRVENTKRKFVSYIASHCV